MEKGSPLTQRGAFSAVRPWQKSQGTVLIFRMAMRYGMQPRQSVLPSQSPAVTALPKGEPSGCAVTQHRAKASLVKGAVILLCKMTGGFLQRSVAKPPLRAKGRCRTSVRRRGWAVHIQQAAAAVIDTLKSPQSLLRATAPLTFKGSLVDAASPKASPSGEGEVPNVSEAKGMGSTHTAGSCCDY